MTMIHTSRSGCWVLCMALLLPAILPAAENSPTKEELHFFEMKVRPLLVAKCQKCHGDNKQKGDLRLDSLVAMKLGGETGPAVVPGHPEKSLLIDAVLYKGLEMPPDGRLPEEEVAVLRDWVKMGAPWPKESEPELTVRAKNKQISAEDRAWWSFQPVVRPEVPSVHDANWSQNAIDRFILARLNSEGIKPSAEASLRTLARRAKFDLTGLPLTAAELEEIQASVSAGDTYERMVDRWLESPQFGENWARNWLDLVRYAESDGYKQDAYRKTAWRYRDYVIRSFNQDKSYARFVREQLAGDEITPHDGDAVVATGFLRAGIYEYNQRDVRTQWENIVNEMTDVTADVFLGISLNCARCHDHKYDPLLREDYYRIRAVFAPVALRDELPAVSAKELHAHRETLAAWEAKTAELRATIEQIENVARERASKSPVEKFPDDIRAIFAKPESFRTPYEQQLAELAWRQVEIELEKIDYNKALSGEAKERWTAAKKELAALLAEKPQPLPTAIGVTDIGPEAPVTFVTAKGKEEVIEPAPPSVFEGQKFTLSSQPMPNGTTGRRTALANWITSPENPLTSRVIVNRVWHFHFGRGLSSTPSDLGKLGSPPTHPELLDWMAAELIASGWSLKHLHRLIVTSQTYRQASHGSAVEDSFAKDSANQWFGRYPIRRLSAEQIRDAILAVTGELNPTAGGASVETSVPRRTVYTKVQRNKFDPLLDEFDAPDNILPTAVRSSTVTPNQSLLLINGAWGLARAKTLAAQVAGEKTADLQIEKAYLRVLGREPTAAEKDAALAFFYAEGKKSNDAKERLLDFCHVLLNSNEFMYID